MAYARKYKITQGAKGYWIWELNDLGTYDQINIPFNTREEAEAGIKRISSAKAWHYDENGEAV